MGHCQTLSRCQVDGAPLDSRRGIEREHLKSGHWLSGESHLGGKPRAKCAVGVLYEFQENSVPAKLQLLTVRVAFPRPYPGAPFPRLATNGAVFITRAADPSRVSTGGRCQGPNVSRDIL